MMILRTNPDHDEKRGTYKCAVCRAAYGAEQEARECAASDHANAWFVRVGGCLNESTAGDACGSCANCQEWKWMRLRLRNK